MRSTILAAGWIAVCLAPATTRALDSVIDHKGNRKSGIIVKDNIEGVLMRFKMGGDITIAPENIAEVQYAQTPRSYTLGVSMFKAGRYDSALISLEEAFESEDKNPLLKQYILYHIAQCQIRLKQYQQAEIQLKKLLTEVPDTRFGPEARKWQINVYLNNKRYRKARELIKQMKRSQNPKQRARARLLDALIYEREGEYGRAKELYEGTASQGGSMGAEASVGMARCDLKRKRYASAVRQAEKAIRSGDRMGEAVYAQAHLVIGNALFEQAKKANDSLRYKKALYAFLRVPMLYPGDEQTEPEALYKAGRCFEALDEKTSKRRALDMYNRAIRKYDGSPWIKQSQARLAHVR